MKMRLRIPPAWILGDEATRACILNEPTEGGLNAPIPGCPLIVQRQLGVDDIGENVGADRGSTAHRLHLEFRLWLEEVIRHVEPLVEVPIVFEDKAVALKDVEH